MAETSTPYDSLLTAVSRAGSQSELARRCGVSQTAVWKWLNSKRSVPAEYVLAVESATGVSRHDLRPDIYPHDMPVAAPAVIAGGAGAVACGRKALSQLGEPAR